MYQAENVGLIIMEDFKMRMSSNKAESLSVIPGILLAGVFLSSSGILPNKPFEILPVEISNVMLVITAMFGTVKIIKSIILWFSTSEVE